MMPFKTPKPKSKTDLLAELETSLAASKSFGKLCRDDLKVGGEVWKKWYPSFKKNVEDLQSDYLKLKRHVIQWDKDNSGKKELSKARQDVKNRLEQIHPSVLKWETVLRELDTLLRIEAATSG